VDLVTLALNLYTQGIEPSLDFSNINDVVRTVEYAINFRFIRVILMSVI